MSGWSHRAGGRHPGRGEIALSLAVLLGLALPLMPIPGDAPAHMEVRFRAAGARATHAFATRTMWSACTVLAAALTYEDPTTGTFTRITCR